MLGDRMGWFICVGTWWQGYPSINKEFEGLTSFKTHRLETLLKLAGIEQRIKKRYFTEWSLVTQWDPEIRYRPAGSISPREVQEMLNAVRKLRRVL